MAYVYEHIRLDNNQVFYVGISSDDESDDETQKYKRAYTTTGRNYLWYRTIKQTDYEVRISYKSMTWSEACEKEIELIALYGRQNRNGGLLVNLTEGGEGFKKSHNDTTKSKISKKLSNKSYEQIHGIKNAESEKEKRRDGVKRYWDNLSDEDYQKRRDVHVGKGKPHSGAEKPIECPHCGKSGRASCMVRWHFENCPTYTGKKHTLSKEHREKLRKSKSKH